MTQATLPAEHSAIPRQLHVALELGGTRWKLAASSGGMKVTETRVGAGDVDGLWDKILAAKARRGVPPDAPGGSCYEAGRDGFWLHRELARRGMRNIVVDSASIEVNRRARRAKTDRLDARKLLTMLGRYEGGEQTVWRVVRIPTVEEEDARRLHRELDRLTKERTAHVNRIRALLGLHGGGPPHRPAYGHGADADGAVAQVHPARWPALAAAPARGDHGMVADRFGVSWMVYVAP